MKFDDPQEVDQMVYAMKQADMPRSEDRLRINQLFNGVPPFTADEAEQNGIVVNVNSLEPTRLAHDARSQFFGAFLKPGNYFTASTDMGTRSRRLARGTAMTKIVNRVMKRSLPYFETMRNKFSSDVLHGIGPAVWDNDSSWCPDMVGIDDILIPARTYLTMKNLPFFAVHHCYTVPELIKLTRGPHRDPAWNMDLVNETIEYIDKQTMALMGSNWPEIWSPEKLGERVKGDGGFYAADTVATADVWDVYAWEDDGEKSGWERRMILDAWSPATISGPKPDYRLDFKNDLHFSKGKWLYNSGRRKVASKLSNLVAFQFADLSPVAPNQYHSIRSLGWLEYAVCQLQNRLRCKFNEAVFENLMMLLRVKTLDEAERALKINLVSRGIIDESVSFVTQAERHQINTQLVELGLNENRRLINENTQSYRGNFQDESGERKTKFQAMSELSATTALVQAGLTQAYQYQLFEYYEIFRRFLQAPPKCRDPEVLKARSEMLAADIPEKMLVAEAWELEPERIMGAGNKALEMQIAQQLMQFRQLYDPDPQRQILRDVTLAITDDPARAEQLVPETRNRVTDSVHDAQLAAGALMQGLPVALKTGYDHGEYVETLLKGMKISIQRIQKRGQATQEELEGLDNVAQHADEHLKVLAQDPESKQRVKVYNDAKSKLMNDVKALAQQLQERMQAQQQNGNGGLDPKDAAKIQGIMLTAKVKAKNQAESHAQRTAQRQLQWELEEKRRAEEHRREMTEQHLESAHNLATNRLSSLRSTE